MVLGSKGVVGGSAIPFERYWSSQIGSYFPKDPGDRTKSPKKSFGIPPIIDAPHKAPFVEYRDDI